MGGGGGGGQPGKGLVIDVVGWLVISYCNLYNYYRNGKICRNIPIIGHAITGELVFGGLMIGGNFAFQNGLGLTIKQLKTLR